MRVSRRSFGWRWGFTSLAVVMLLAGFAGADLLFEGDAVVGRVFRRRRTQ